MGQPTGWNQATRWFWPARGPRPPRTSPGALCRGWFRFWAAGSGRIRSHFVLATRPYDPSPPLAPLLRNLTRVFLEVLNRFSSFVLVGHEHPDGDCLGSQVGLYHLLTAMGKRVAIRNPDPAAAHMDFLRTQTPVWSIREQDDLPEDLDLIVLLDCARFDRTGALGPRLKATGAKVAVIDHHVGSENGDGHFAFVDPDAAATGVLVHQLYQGADVPLTKVAAEGLFVALASDTGWFRYSNTDSSVLRMAAELAAAGVDSSEVYDLIHRRQAKDSIAVLGDGLQGAQLLLDGRFAMVQLDKAAMERANKAGFDTDQVMEPLRCLEGVEVVAMLKERFDGGVKVSLRARREIDVQAIARVLGGGGHRKAAGATVEGQLEVVGHQVTELVDASLANHFGVDGPEADPRETPGG